PSGSVYNTRTGGRQGEVERALPAACLQNRHHISGAERREPGAVRLKADWHIDSSIRRTQEGQRRARRAICSGRNEPRHAAGAPSGRAAVTVMLDGKSIGDARVMDEGLDGSRG